MLMFAKSDDFNAIAPVGSIIYNYISMALNRQRLNDDVYIFIFEIFISIS